MVFFFFQAEDGIRDVAVTGVQTCALPILSSGTPHALLVSTVTGDQVAAGLLDADYWWRNIRSPVRFTDGMATLVDAGFRLFVEIGANPVLQSYLHDALRTAEGQGQVLATLSRKQGSEDPFPEIAARCHVAGHDISAAERFDGPADLCGLPLYPWQKQRFWLNHLDPEVLPWLADHAIEGVPVLPATAVLEMALAAAWLRRPEARAVEVVDVELRRPLPFDKGRPREIRTVVIGEDGDWELSSRPRLADEPLTLHAVARLATAGDRQVTPLFPERKPARGEVDAETLYRLAGQLGLNYGSQFRTVTRIELLGSDEALAHLDSSVIDEPLDGYLIHPALVDGALQALLALIADHHADLEGVSFLPWRFGRVRIAAPFGRPACRARLRVTRLGTRSASADIALFDAAGEIVGELSDCWFRRVELTRRLAPEDSALRVDLVPAPLAEPASAAVLGRIKAIVAQLVKQPANPGDQHDEHALLLDALIASVALQSVVTIVDPDVLFAIEDVIEAGSIAPDSVALFEYLLRLLTRFGAASEAGRVWRIAQANDLPDIAEVWRLLLAEAPKLVAELALIAALAEEMPRLLADGPRQADASPVPMVEHLLHGSPVSAAGIDLVCAVLGKIAARWPKGRRLRVLEVGADGGATRRLLEHLAQSGVALAYRATNPDQEQAARLGFIVSTIAGASAGCWSPRDAGDDLGDSCFDVIVSVHAGARLQLDTTALSQLRDLLVPGGLFIAVEPAPNPLWDLVFGRYAGWWRGGNDSAEVSPLSSSEEWRSDLAMTGFADFGTAALATGPWPSSVLWGRAHPVTEAPEAEPATPYSISLIAAGGDNNPTLSEELVRAGHRVSTIDAGGFAAMAEHPGAEAEAENDNEIALIVIGAGAEAVEEAAQLISVVARVATAAAQRHIPLWLITCGAQQSVDGDECALVGAALWGFGRVLMNEIPRLALHLVDLAPTMSWAERADRIVSELAAETDETEIVWTKAGRHLLRLRRGLPPRWATATDAVALTTEQQGGLDSLGWQLAAPRPPGPGEVAIDVHASGLNFRDLMWAMGLLPEEALTDGFAGPTFGLECAGIISAVGAGVADLAVGDRVAGFAPAALSTQVTTAAHAVTRIPLETSFAAAATIPVVFVTAVYALGTLAKLMPGELVLIHAAAGGVGLAAIQYAKHRGAVVIATAGSEVKRAFLRLAGADYVVDSRDLGFAAAVRAISGGGGVDVVLNSLSGEAMEQSLGVLKPFGRFLELGKRDFYLNRRVHLRPLRQNISYFAIDVDQLPVQRPDLARSLLSEVSAALSEGAIRPLAHRTFGFGAIGDAFRLMPASGYVRRRK